MSEDWQKRVRQHSNDANYFRRSSSILFDVAMDTIGEKELRRRLDEKHAGDIMGTVEARIR